MKHSIEPLIGMEEGTDLLIIERVFQTNVNHP